MMYLFIATCLFPNENPFEATQRHTETNSMSLPLLSSSFSYLRRTQLPKNGNTLIRNKDFQMFFLLLAVFPPNYFHISFGWHVFYFCTKQNHDTQYHSREHIHTQTNSAFLTFLIVSLIRLLWNIFSPELLSFVDNLLNYFISFVLDELVSTF